jgi:plastocyanin
MKRTGRLGRLLAGLVAVLAVTTACGSSDQAGGAGTAPPAPPAATGPAAAGGSTVVIDNFMFMPATVTFPVGTTVTWKFSDSTQHTVTANDNSFSSPPMAGGQTFAHTFGAAGTVAYHCSIHPFMTGTIVVR